MDASRPKKKRSELELLLGNGDAGGLSSFSPRLPALSMSCPVLVDAFAESDEQLARRLHEELNGMRITRRGSKAVTEDGLSPPAVISRGLSSPHGKPKAETGSTPKANGGTLARTTLPSVPPLPEVTFSAAQDAGPSTATDVRATAAGAGLKSTDCGPGLNPGLAYGPSGNIDGGGNEAVKRKRHSVPARELHLLLQQASTSAAAGRADTALSPTRSGRTATLAAARMEASAASNDLHPSQQQARGSQQSHRRESDRNQQHSHQHQPAASAASAPDAAPPSPGATPLLPPPLLPPRLKQRYLAGYISGNLGPGLASASASNDVQKVDTAVVCNGGITTGATPSGVMSGARNSLLSGQSMDGGSILSRGQCHSQSLSPSRGRRAGFGAGALYTPPEVAAAGCTAGGINTNASSSVASLAAAVARSLAATGASIGGCSSTDETETDNDNSCATAVVCAGDGGPLATSPKAPLLQAQQLLPPSGTGSLTPLTNAPAAAVTAVAGRSSEADLTEEVLDSHRPQGRPQRQSAAASGAAMATAASQPPSVGSCKGQAPGAGLSGPLKVPKLPMICAGRGWYRGRLMGESVDGERVLVEVPGAPNSDSDGQQQPFWLPVTSDLIWRGSYKGKDWKYLGDGAWEPKPAAFKRGKQGSSSNGLPLPLPVWAVHGEVGAAAELEPQLDAAGGGDIGALPAKHQRSKRDRGGWSSPEEGSDDAGVMEEEQPPQQSQRAAVEGAINTRSGQLANRRVSAPDTASNPACASAGSGKGVAVVAPTKAVVPSDNMDAKGLCEEALKGAEEADVQHTGAGAKDAADDSTAFAATRCDSGQAAHKAMRAHDVSKHGCTTVKTKIAATAPVAALEPEPVPLSQAVAAADDDDVPGSREDGGRCSGADDFITATATAAESGAAADAPIANVESMELSGSGGMSGVEEGPAGGGDGADPDGDEEPLWGPGVVYPRRSVPRRARRRQQRLRTPLDGLQLPLPHHHQVQHNPYAFYPLLSDESGGDVDASDVENGGGGGRRGSGDGAGGAAQPGSRRRAAARAAAVAAAVARAEAEAEEEEQEEILLGRRPPRRDRFHVHLHISGSSAGTGCRRTHHQCHTNHRSRSAARPDYYLYGDSSGNLDDAYTGDMAAGQGNVPSVRSRVGICSNSQPASMYISGGCGAWEPGQWQPGGQGNGGDGGAAQAQPRNRRKGKPSRSRMDGEGDAWCYGEEEWEKEAAGSAWARMPEVLRRLYFTPCSRSSADGRRTDGSGAGRQERQQQGHQGGESSGRPSLHRQSGGGGYYGATANTQPKRQRVYEEDTAIWLEDMEMEVDDHERDADYLPYGSGSRRSSGFGSGRRCSANGGGGFGPGPAARRPRNGDASQSHPHQQYGICQYQLQHLGMYGDGMSHPPRRRILLSYDWDPGNGVPPLTGMESGGIAGGGADGIPAGLAGLLEAALGQDTNVAAGSDDVLQAVEAGDNVRHAVMAANVKMEDEVGGRATAMRTMEMAAEMMPTAASAMPASGSAVASLHSSQLQLTFLAPPPPPPPSDPHSAHVALSDSSAAPSGADEGKFVTTTLGSMAADIGSLTTCGGGGDRAIALSLLMPPHHHGGGSSSGGAAMTPAVYGISSGGTPPPPGVQLRPNTPTRARRTGRPPFAGAPLPKLPALSSAASLRLQTGGMTATGMPAATADGTSVGCDVVASAVTAAVDAAHMTSFEAAMDIEGLQSGAEAVPGDMPAEGTSADEVVAVRPGDQCCTVAAGGVHEDDAVQDVCRDNGASCRLWHAAELDTCSNRAGMGLIARAAAATSTAATVHSTAAPVGDACFGNLALEVAMCEDSMVNAGAVLGDAMVKPHADDGGSGRGGGGGGGTDVTGCCVMDAIGSLLYDKQPAMQQLAMRAQVELDCLGLHVVSQQHRPYHFSRSQYGAALYHPPLPDDVQVQQQVQRLMLLGRSADASLQSGCTSMSTSPPAQYPLLSSLPSVEVVMSLFSSRTHFGSTQQALADLVGGAAALPLFQ